MGKESRGRRKPTVETVRYDRASLTGCGARRWDVRSLALAVLIGAAGTPGTNGSTRFPFQPGPAVAPPLGPTAPHEGA